jgi:zinc transporter ZupT
MAASFYSSPLIGATTTLACFAHEIPHEIADYSILVRSGFTKRQAMMSQFGTAIGAFVSSFACAASRERASIIGSQLTCLRYPFFLGPFLFNVGLGEMPCRYVPFRNAGLC